MGVMFNDICFDGKWLSEFGVVPSGEAVYNSPERDVKEIEVPGRNGSLFVDNGRYKNITVTYPISITGDFKKNVDELTGFLKSRYGYCELRDTYHTDEYRMAVFVEGLDWEVTALGREGQTALIFNCKPQRFLDSGNKEIVMNNEKLTSDWWTMLSQDEALDDILEKSNFDDTIKIAADLQGFDNWIRIDFHNIPNTPKQGIATSVFYIAGYKADATRTLCMISNGKAYTTTQSSNDVYYLNMDNTCWYMYIPYEVGVAITAIFDLQGGGSEADVLADEFFKKYTLINPTPLSSTPLFKIETDKSGVADEVLQINSQTIKFAEQVLKDVYIDTETMNAYAIAEDGTIINMNNRVIMPTYDIVLNGGENIIMPVNSCKSVTVMPRWYKI